ncbi:hypothetical protein TNCV_2786181 [Trichonephila clavipes]|nr:hypothetical protein TNCV_2786181 [Trichonephila clavipes]
MALPSPNCYTTPMGELCDMTDLTCIRTSARWCFCDVENVPPTKETREVESLLFGRFREKHTTIAPSPPYAVYFVDGGWRRNYVCLSPYCRRDQGSQRLTYLRTSALGCPAWDTFPRETA